MTRGSALKPGDKLGQYELLVPVGAGGMGRVWAARERNTTLKPRLVAIKTALSEEGATEGFWKVLFDEGRIASQVTHPNVCSIHAVERERGIVYLVMDWSDGGSLREMLDSLPHHRLELHMAARIVARVCSGLHAVHELVGEDGEPLGVVHRNVSPQNILISTKGQVRITDFGVAKARGQVHAPTQTGEVKGKIAYMAPEQVTTKDIDRRANVFALGCVLYESTTGQRPFQGGDALATLYALLEQPLIRPSERLAGYPPDLEAVVLKALERNPADRYPTAEELGRALEIWLVKDKVSVSDTNIATALIATLNERIAGRAKEIEGAIQGIEQPEQPTNVLPRPDAPDAASIVTLGGSATPMPSRISTPSPKSKLGYVVAGLALLAGGAFAVSRVLGGSVETPADSAHVVAPVVAPAASVDSAPPAATTVEITLRAEPASAVLFVDDGPELPNPYKTTMAPDTHPHKVRAKADGYADSEQIVVFDRAQNIALSLRPETTRKPGGRKVTPVRTTTAAAPTPTPAPTPAQDPGMPVVRKPLRTLDNDNPFAKKP